MTLLTWSITILCHLGVKFLRDSRLHKVGKLCNLGKTFLGQKHPTQTWSKQQRVERDQGFSFLDNRSVLKLVKQIDILREKNRDKPLRRCWLRWRKTGGGRLVSGQLEQGGGRRGGRWGGRGDRRATQTVLTQIERRQVVAEARPGKDSKVVQEGKGWKANWGRKSWNFRKGIFAFGNPQQHCFLQQERMYVGIRGVPAGWIDPSNLSSPLLFQPQVPKYQKQKVSIKILDSWNWKKTDLYCSLQS